MRPAAIVLAAVLLALLAWVAFQPTGVEIFVDGRRLEGPARLAAQGWGLLVAVVALLCVAILLAFVLTGIGLIVLGALVLAGLAAAGLALPFLLPLLIPLFVVWLVVAVVQRRGKSGG